MSQRKALVASVVITLVLALSAIGIRATFFDSQDAAADPETGVTLVVPGTGSYDDDDQYEESDDDGEHRINNAQDEEDDHDDSEDSDHEEEHEDDEH